MVFLFLIKFKIIIVEIMNEKNRLTLAILSKIYCGIHSVDIEKTSQKAKVKFHCIFSFQFIHELPSDVHALCVCKKWSIFFVFAWKNRLLYILFSVNCLGQLKVWLIFFSHQLGILPKNVRHSRVKNIENVVDSMVKMVHSTSNKNMVYLLTMLKFLLQYLNVHCLSG